VTEPYRTGLAPCPNCGRELRIDAERLRCDGCGGTMLGYPEVRESLGIPREGRLVWVDGKLGRRKCPRCTAHMLVTCIRLTSTKVLSDLTLDRCETDGVWFDRNELSKLIAAPRS